MPLHRIPVTIPYTLTGDPQAALFTVQVTTVATAPNAALATACALVEALSRMRHPGRGTHVVTERAQVGVIGPQVTGMYGYVLTNGFSIPLLEFPARLDQNAAQAMTDAFAGIDDRNLFGVIADCVYLNYVSSMGIAAIIGNSTRLRLRLIRPPESVLRVFDMVGLRKHLAVHTNLTQGLDDLVGDYLRVAATVR